MIKRLFKNALIGVSAVVGVIYFAVAISAGLRLIAPAFGQATETAKITEAYLDRGVLGITCAALLLAVVALFTLLIRAYNEKARLIEIIIRAVEQGKTSADDNTEAVKANTAAVGALTKAVETLAREAEGEARETRHGVNNLAAIVSANAEMIRTVQTACSKIPTLSEIRDAVRDKPL